MSKTSPDQSVSASWPVIGHTNIVSYLQQCLASAQLAHAYLLVGPAHLGKTTVAGFFVNALVESSAQLQEPILASAEPKFHPDIHWLARQVNGKTGKIRKNISIEQVRQLQNKLSLHSFLNTRKVGVITEAHTLSLEAANSLLKTLEEPTPNTVLILIAENMTALPRTIVSRCQVLKFLPVAKQDIFDSLLSLKIERKKAKHLAQLSFGKPGLALFLASNPQAYSDQLSAGRNFLALLRASTVERFKAVDELVKTSTLDNLYQTLNLWQLWLRDLMLVSSSANSLVAHTSLEPDLVKLAQEYSPAKLLQAFSNLRQTQTYLKANVNPKLALENLILTL